MSFQSHPDAYHQPSLKHQQLIAAGELERQLRAAHAERITVGPLFQPDTL